MKNSSFSPISPQCPLHFSQEITHFCINTRCFLPLCADCLPQHLELHKKIEKIDTVSQKCKEKLSKALLILAEKTESFLNNSPLFSNQSLFEEGLEKIQRIRQLFIDKINEFFDNFKGNYSKLMAPLLENDSKITQIFEKIQSFSNRLHYYLMKLESNGRNIEVLQSICSINLGELAKKAFQDLKTLRKSREFEGFCVNFNENSLKDLENLAKNNVFFEKPHKLAPSLEFSARKPAILPYFLLKSNEICLFLSEMSEKSQETDKIDTFVRKTLESEPILANFHQIATNSAENLVYLITEREIFKYQEAQNSLIRLETLKFPRLHFSLSIVFAKNLVIIGGVSEKEPKKCLKSCEMYESLEKRVVSLQELAIPLAFASCCSFHEKFVYLFGGFTEDFEASQRIFRLDVEKNSWKSVDPCVDFGFELRNFAVNSNSWRSLQVNSEEIVIFSGKCEEFCGGNFVFNAKKKEISRMKGNFWGNGYFKEKKLRFYGEPTVEGRNICVLAKDEENCVVLCVFDSEINEWSLENVQEKLM